MANDAPCSWGEIDRPRKYICPAIQAAAMASRTRLSTVLTTVLLLLEQELAGRYKRLAARPILLDHGPRAMELARELVDVAVAAQPDEAVMKRGLRTLLHPGALGALLAGQETEVDPDGRVVARVDETDVLDPSAVGEYAPPREMTALEVAGGPGRRGGR